MGKQRQPRPRFRLKAFINPSGAQSWRVEGRLNGRRIRENHALLADAQERLGALESEAAGVRPAALQRTGLTPGQLADAATALQSLRARSLAEAIGTLNSAEDRVRAMGIGLNDALAFVEKHYRPDILPTSLASAVEQFIAHKENRSPKTQVFYENNLSRLVAAGPDRAVHEVGLVDIEAIIDRYKNLNSRRTVRRALTAFFNWAARRRYVLENPCERLEAIPADRSEIIILDIDDVERLLQAAVVLGDTALVSVLAIALFGGLRPSEIVDLKAADVRGDEILVTGGKLRRKINRTVPSPPVLRAWLKKYPFQGVPTGMRGKLNRIRLVVKGPWAQDVLRHTSISFQMLRDKDENRVAFNNGTSREMVHRHYYSVTDKPDAVTRFWNLTPHALRARAVAVDVKTTRKVAWPGDKELAAMIAGSSLRAVAATLGVSDVAVGKRCRTRGIQIGKAG